MLKMIVFAIGCEQFNHANNTGLRVMQNPGFTYLHSAKRNRNAASLRLPE